MLTALLLLLSPANAGKVKVGPVDLPDTLGSRTVPMSDFAIPNEGCEGTDGYMVIEVLPEELKAELLVNYPHDQATGFQPDDLRGWFWVEVNP